MLDQTLRQLCDALDAALACQGSNGRVTGGTVTPYEIRLNVVTSNGHSLDAAALSEALGVPVQVRPAPGGFTVYVPRPDRDPYPVRLSNFLRGLRDMPEVTAVLGLADDGVPLLIRLPSPTVQHILVSGPAGCGKSALLRTAAISLAYFTPHLKIAAPPPPDLARLVRMRQARRETWPPVVALYDGLPLALDGLGEALRDGWRYGVHIILATRHTAPLGNLADLFPARICGTETPGDFRAYAEGQTYRFWAAWPDVEAAALGRGTLCLPAGR
ncbi:MAG: hypothetical protein RML46_09255 [Anaerolineae bacterium]|nr:hypothetical protein [Anaerolineae bacterium]